VEADHTYFVGDDEWGFAVWAHNQSCEFKRLSSRGQDVFENDGPSRRLFEGLRGANLDPPNNFPVIDRYNRRTALGTSMKTIDLNSARAQDPKEFRRLIRSYVEKLRGFQGDARFSSTLGREVVARNIKARSLEIGVQEGLLQGWQKSAMRSEARRAGRITNPVSMTVFELFREDSDGPTYEGVTDTRRWGHPSAAPRDLPWIWSLGRHLTLQISRTRCEPL
jgi:hypothetical protein